MSGGTLNKTMDRDDLEARAAADVVDDLNRLVLDLRRDGLRASTWYGSLEPPDGSDGWERTNRGYGYAPLAGAADDASFPWFLYWEIAWIACHTAFRPGDRVLDLGGSSSLFSFYLASKGIEVTTVDLNAELVDNADRVAARRGWAMTNLVTDMRELALDAEFDHVTSVCVFEHLPVSARVEVSERLRDLLVDGGSFSATFDYGNPSRLARISGPEAVEEQMIAPSGLSVRGNRRFHDNGKRYLLHPFHHPRAEALGWKEGCIELGQFEPSERDVVKSEDEYTFGALFLRR